MSERGKSGIYAIRCLPTGKTYVGQAVSIGDRWLTHRSHLNCGRHANRHLQAAWSKHGADAFAFEVLAYTESAKDALAFAEQAWIERRRPAFNLAPAGGSSLGLKHPPRSDAFRARMGEIKRGFRHRQETIDRLRALAAAQDYHPTPEHIEKLRRINTGKVKTQESIEKQRRAMRGRKQTPESVAKRAASNTGQKRTPEQCRRISEAKRSAFAARRGEV